MMPFPTPHTMMKRLAILLFLLPLPVQAETINGESLNEILQLVRQFGDGELRRDKQDAPLIAAAVDGPEWIQYRVEFYGCNFGPPGCDDIRLIATWTGVEANETVMNRWNRATRFGRANIDLFGDVILDFTVNLAHGIEKHNFGSTLNWWKSELENFRQFLLENTAG